MDQDMFVQRLPLFDSSTSYRPQLLTTTTRRRHPSLVAIGSSCRVTRSADSAGAAPSIAPFAPSYRVLSCHGARPTRAPRTAGPLRSQDAVPRARKTTQRELSTERGADLSQLIWEEQVARLELQCREQERRVDLALFTRAHRWRCREAPESASESLSSPMEDLHKFPTVPKIKATRSPKVYAGSESLPGRRDRWTSLRDLDDEKNKDTTPPLACAQPLPTLLYARDSELLRALQRAEARIYELEAEASSLRSSTTANHREAESECSPKRCSMDAFDLSAASPVSSTLNPDEPHQESQPAGYIHVCRNLVII
ncbi:hypothetical protein ABL78_2976 [Leptomonas seymouri]|uniref:Uncharacterized protein n=1 Tax=Leptomonas seymouri TaxID=5684 RepID=A0A0N0P756_LEPSE|nr:hypothetical protein ABL78_2976 [Leptomonas seymouri]|eukprot:KPI87937.1 hypothetical protein ABL78_2976 [Leptomonas seymouri]